MPKIKFSVLMSVYYKEKKEYLKTAIDSIINQTIQPNEFLIVEDGPLTDELNLLIDEYEQKYDYIRTIKLEKNCGLGEALRIGVENCKYEYIARMDSDDYSLPNRFEKQLKYIEENPDVDLLGGQLNECNEEMQEIIAIRRVPTTEEEIRKRLKTRNPFNHVTVIYKKSAVLSCGNYETMLYFEDYYLWCKMICNKFNCINMDEILVNTRSGQDYFQRRGGIKFIKAMIKFEKSIRKMGVINTLEYIKIILIRIAVAVLPGSIRKKIYIKKLRNKNNME